MLRETFGEVVSLFKKLCFFCGASLARYIRRSNTYTGIMCNVYPARYINSIYNVYFTYCII